MSFFSQYSYRNLEGLMSFRPTALRSTNCAICYAPIVMQCLMSLPQLRRRLLHYNTECVGVDEYHGIPD